MIIPIIIWNGSLLTYRSKIELIIAGKNKFGNLLGNQTMVSILQ
jgi:hypothetical protein